MKRLICGVTSTGNRAHLVVRAELDGDRCGIALCGALVEADFGHGHAALLDRCKICEREERATALVRRRRPEL